MSNSPFSYRGKTVLVVGGATGMGAAAARLAASEGAEIIVMDVSDVSYPVRQSINVDLRDQGAIDSAVSKLSCKVDVVFSCAGVADGFPGLMLINFIGQQYLIEALIDKGLLGRGGAVVMISSVGGMGWHENLPTVLDFLGQPDWDSAVAWVENHKDSDNYNFSKQAMNGYVANRSMDYAQKGIRINAVLPGPTDTPLARANADVWLGFGAEFRQLIGVEALTPEQIGSTMLFLGGDAASGINGISLMVDHGHVSASTSGAYDEPALENL